MTTAASVRVRIVRETAKAVERSRVTLAGQTKRAAKRAARRRAPQSIVAPSAELLGGALVVTVPLRLVSVANLREHWAAKANRTKSQRAITGATLEWCVPFTWGELFRRPTCKTLVTVTRLGPRTLDRADNLPMSAKATVDAVAEWLGVDDRSELLEIRYAQEKSKAYGCRIRIEVRSVA